MIVNVFDSKEIMDAVEKSIAAYARPDDVPQMMDLIRKTNLESKTFINQITYIIKRYFTTKRTIAIIVELSRRLKELIKVDIQPKLLEISQGEQLSFKVKITNNSGLPSKFRIITEQENKDTPVIYDPKKNFVDFKREVEALIDSPQTKVMNITVKPEMFGIKDLDIIKREGHVNFKVNVKVESLDIIGIKNQNDAIVGIFR